MQCVAMKFSSDYLILVIGCLLLLVSGAVQSAKQPFFPKHYENLTCILPNGDEGSCVYAYLCKKGVIETYGESLVDLRFGDTCEDYLLKCCSKETACLGFKGQCVPEEKCGVDITGGEFHDAQKECAWSGYTCCPVDEVGKKKEEVSDVITPDISIPDVSQQESDVSPTEVPDASQPEAPDASQSEIPEKKKCFNQKGICTPVGSCNGVKYRDRRNECGGLICCSSGDSADEPVPIPAEKTCFNQKGICTPAGSCKGVKYRDRRNECGALTCCSLANSADESVPIPTEPPSSIVSPTEGSKIVNTTEATDITIPGSSLCMDYIGQCQLAEHCSRIAEEPTECQSTGKVCCLEIGRKVTTTETPPESEYVSRGCGHRNEQGVHFKLINANEGESEYGEFPWVVAIMTKANKFVCAGSLIDPEVVLTTAACARPFRNNPKKILVRAGEWDMGTLKEPIPYEERQVRLVKMHPAFKATTLVNNIALIFLEDKFDLNKMIETVCLPPQSFTVDNGDVLATGWGETPKDRTKFQQILKKLELPFYARSECERTLRRFMGNYVFKLDDSFMCAGGDMDIDTCRGDAGSPIVFPIPDDFDNRFYAVGMVSWGIGCGKPGIPGVYTDISKYRDWIDDLLNEENVSLYYYQYQRHQQEGYETDE